MFINCLLLLLLVPCEARDGPLRWGIMGSGKIASDFVGALKDVPSDEMQVVAVGARSIDSARDFADKLNLDNAHGSYEALAADENVDVIYVGTVAQAHSDCVRIALAAGKAVLCEKPLALCASDALALTEEARARGLFLMEGMWTRTFPAIQKARALLKDGAIGDVVAVATDFGWPADPHGEHARTLDALSGGVSLDVAMYPLAAILLATGATRPEHVVATGTTRASADGDGLVDWSVAAALSWPQLSATVLCTLDGSTPEEVVYTGTRGTLRVHRAAHTPTRLTLSVAGASREDADEEVLDFPMPPVPALARPFNYPGSQGFVYEARAVAAALRAGMLECPDWTHAETVTAQACLDAIRRQVIAPRDGHVQHARDL